MEPKKGPGSLRLRLVQQEGTYGQGRPLAMGHG